MKHLHSRQLAQPLFLVLLISGFGLNAQGQFTISNQEPITTVPNSAAAAAYTDTTVASGTSYCYAVTEVDSVTALQSPNSNLSTAVIA